jgi:bifunctional non-homologous end joining protein LigD
MLARSAPMPTRHGFAFEPKWDGFRALLSTERGFRMISRRRWNMTALVEELCAFPARGVFDGELVAFEDGQVDFVALSERVLLRTRTAPIAFIVFDVLYLDGASAMREPYWKRRAILESLDLAGPHSATTPSFDDADGLWPVVVRDGLEGVVAKPRGSVYRPGERGWLKIKNRAYWKYDLEREFVVSERRPRVVSHTSHSR